MIRAAAELLRAILFHRKARFLPLDAFEASVPRPFGLLRASEHEAMSHHLASPDHSTFFPFHCMIPDITQFDDFNSVRKQVSRMNATGPRGFDSLFRKSAYERLQHALTAFPAPVFMQLYTPVGFQQARAIEVPAEADLNRGAQHAVMWLQRTFALACQQIRDRGESEVHCVYSSSLFLSRLNSDTSV